jgi:hypothetical protein
MNHRLLQTFQKYDIHSASDDGYALGEYRGQATYGRVISASPCHRSGRCWSTNFASTSDETFPKALAYLLYGWATLLRHNTIASTQHLTVHLVASILDYAPAKVLRARLECSSQQRSSESSKFRTTWIWESCRHAGSIRVDRGIAHPSHKPSARPYLQSGLCKAQLPCYRVVSVLNYCFTSFRNPSSDQSGIRREC